MSEKSWPSPCPFLLSIIKVLCMRFLTFSMMQTKLIADPMSTCNSPEPKINASGTTTCKFTKCDIIPVAVDICNNKWYKSGWWEKGCVRVEVIRICNTFGDFFPLQSARRAGWTGIEQQLLNNECSIWIYFNKNQLAVKMSDSTVTWTWSHDKRRTEGVNIRLFERLISVNSASLARVPNLIKYFVKWS